MTTTLAEIFLAEEAKVERRAVMTKNLTEEEVRLIALAAVRAAADVEGWATDHQSLNFGESGEIESASYKFREEFKRQLRRLGFVVRRD
jgi:hypothetical protein